MKMIDFTYLGKLIYVSIQVLRRFTIEDRKHTITCKSIIKFAPLFRGA